MAFNINVANSCKLLSLRAKRYDATSTQASIVFTDLETTATYSTVMAYDNTGKGNLNVPVANLPSANGVYKVCLSEGGIEYTCKPVLIKCNIDCCLTKLTNEIIDCSCDCPRCASALAKAQKVFLLLESAASAVEIAGVTQSDAYFIDILEKYLKAKEICDNSCGCDC